MAISLIIARRTGERALEFSHALECRAMTMENLGETP